MKKETKIIHSGRNYKKQAGCVNPPLYQASTILFPTLEDYHAAERGVPYYEETKQGSAHDYGYGINGTPTTFALQDVLRQLEGGDECVITQSGLSAITTALLSFVESGDHILVVDTVYGPTRRFCNKELKKIGVEVTYYDPEIGSDIAKLIKKNTRLIFLESPGSLTFEVQDVPAIVKIAKAKNITTIIDNSWATPLYFQPLALGVDVSIQAITKNISGHADVILGAIITKGKEAGKKVLSCYRVLGQSSSPADCWLALRGVRSLAARLERQQRTTDEVIKFLEGCKEVQKILYPAHPKFSGYKLWKKQFSGANSLFTIVLDKKYPQKNISAFINGLEFFGIGASWGGYESLAISFDPTEIRTATKWRENTPCLRFYIGQENAEDLIKDLEKGFKRLK